MTEQINLSYNAFPQENKNTEKILPQLIKLVTYTQLDHYEAD